MPSIHTPTALAHCSILRACVSPRYHILLKSEIPGANVSASTSAPASRVAITCVVPPAAQPYCSSGENRL